MHASSLGTVTPTLPPQPPPGLCIFKSGVRDPPLQLREVNIRWHICFAVTYSCQPERQTQSHANEMRPDVQQCSITAGLFFSHRIHKGLFMHWSSRERVWNKKFTLT
ncbi:hypothetical protein LSAT2_002500 [Lamellibrachia satsuma]|nr:hypothetical protein LSAT2_002500 [Lamellibrachia satsuma]